MDYYWFDVSKIILSSRLMGLTVASSKGDTYRHTDNVKSTLEIYCESQSVPEPRMTQLLSISLMRLSGVGEVRKIEQQKAVWCCFAGRRVAEG